MAASGHKHSGGHGEEKKNREKQQMDSSLQHGRAAGAEGDDAHEQCQRQQYFLFRVEPEFERLPEHDRNEGHRGDGEADRCK